MSPKGHSLPRLRYLPSPRPNALAPSLKDQRQGGERARQDEGATSSSSTATPLAKRKDAPTIAFSARGSKARALDAAASEGSRELALGTFLRDQFANSAAGPRAAYLRTWIEFHRAWHSYLGREAPEPFPLTVSSIFAVSSMLKAGGYRASPVYASRAKDHHVEQGHRWTEELARAVNRANRSATRGLGPSRQSQALPFSELCSLARDATPLVPDGPLGPRNLLILGSLFCTREIEASLALRSHVSVDYLRSRVSWCLPCDKTDPAAIGKTRSWGCLCRDREAPDLERDCCPYHAMLLQLSFLESRFGPVQSVPLFPTSSGATVLKESVVSTIEKAAELLGIPTKDDQGRNLFGGHSLRVTGAQTMAAMGIPLLTIQLMARWSSSIVMRYVGEAPLASVTDDYRRANHGADLRAYMEASEEVFRHMRSQLQMLDERTLRVIEEERELRKDAPAELLKEDRISRKGPAFIVSSSDKVHVPRSRFFRDWPAFEWRAKCGWLFGLSEHSPVDELPPGSKICRICMPLRGNATRESSSESDVPTEQLC